MSVLTRPPIVTSGLVLHLDAANRKSYPGSGTTWFDMSGNGNSGSLANGAAYSGSYGGSIAFNGVNASVLNSTLTADTALFGTSDFSVDAWFNPNPATVARQTVVGKYSTVGTESGWFMLCNTSGSGNTMTLQYSAGLNGGNGRRYVNGTITTTPGTNIYATLVRNSTVLDLYVNGIKDASATLSAGQNYYAANIPLGIGYNQYTVYGLNLNGIVYSTKVYNRALSAQEILQNYNAQKARFGLP